MVQSSEQNTQPTSTIVQISSISKEASSLDLQGTASVEQSSFEKLHEKMRPLLLYVVSTAQFIDVVNGASVAVAILPIADSLDFSIPQLPWILNAYTIAFAGLLILAGRLGDLFGHRRMFLFGLTWFGIWALVVSFSTNPIMFVIARALQGIGAACTVPTAMALIAINYPVGPQRTKAFSIFAAFGGMGAVVGLLLAGGLIASIGWEWIFRVSSIAAFLLLALGFLAIPVAPLKSEKPKIDYLGATTATVGVTGIVYYITTGVEEGWASAKTLPVFIIGILLIGAFIFIESKVESPLMPLRVWKTRVFAASVVLAFIQMAMFQGVIYYANLVFQEVYGWSPIKTAVGFLVHSLLAIVVFSILGRTLPRLPLKPIIIFGFLLRCITALLYTFVDENTSYWRLIFPALIIHIFGTGFSMLPLQVTAARDADNKDQGLVGAIYNTGLQLGAPFGLAILNVISISTNGDNNGAVRGGPVLMKGYRNSFYGITALGLFGALLTLIILPWDRPNRPAKKATDAATESKLEEGRSQETGSPMKLDIAPTIEELVSDSSKVDSEVSTITSVKDTPFKA
ncbi:hypothetical protein BX616_006301 [Lobosporangium transversale]|uniref:Major facilitator superfamily domain-containing protein n=1 Tax=Lobosporangium transversale TaxID=64571 RepID=A0A1Y2G5W5_9FUNG|nr:major facilitator superfamily domain-containing protein [Lobosporangium transversale]KAF9915369.1 hypothetical protein BX616_006301 [Lobosporangium transversale]ORY96063.1 major facilitator superfamily domain-containing protein [Lobosporangium transversale]|eukprot:XP_021875490.1 major facilitator superfamily domain-containing protein [Lobosporangium transversale]